MGSLMVALVFLALAGLAWRWGAPRAACAYLIGAALNVVIGAVYLVFWP